MHPISELEYDFSYLMQKPKYTVNTKALERFAKALTLQQLVAIIPPINVPILIQLVQSKESESQRIRIGGSCVSGGTTINSSRTNPLLGPSNK